MVGPVVPPSSGRPCCIVLGGVTEAAAQTVVKLAHAVSTQDPYQYGSERFKEFVEKGMMNLWPDHHAVAIL